MIKPSVVTPGGLTLSPDIASGEVIGYVDRSSGSFRTYPRLTFRFSEASTSRPSVKTSAALSKPVEGTLPSGATGVLGTNRATVSIELRDGATMAEMEQLRTELMAIVTDVDEFKAHLFFGNRLV